MEAKNEVVSFCNQLEPVEPQPSSPKCTCTTHVIETDCPVCRPSSPTAELPAPPASPEHPFTRLANLPADPVGDAQVLPPLPLIVHKLSDDYGEKWKVYLSLEADNYFEAIKQQLHDTKLALKEANNKLEESAPLADYENLELALKEAIEAKEAFRKLSIAKIQRVEALEAALREASEMLKQSGQLASIGYHIGEADMRCHDKVGERYGKMQDELIAKIQATCKAADLLLTPTDPVTEGKDK